MKKLTSISQKLDTLFKVAHIALTVLMVAALVGIAIIGAGFLFDLDPNTVGTGYNSLDVGFLDLELAPEAAPSYRLMWIQAAITMALGFVCAFFGRKCVNSIRAIFQPMKEGTPFHSAVTENFRKLGKYTVVLGILLNVLTLAEQAMLVFLMDLPGLLINGTVIHITANFNFDFTFVVISIVFFLLSYIFQYGEELQQLSDETL